MADRTYTADDVPEQLIDQHRYTWVDDDWWDVVFEHWAEVLPERGIDLSYHETRLVNGKFRADPTIYFQLFVQGEYVEFKAETRDEDEWAKLFAHAGCTGKFPVFMEYLKYGGVPFCADPHRGYNRSWLRELDEEMVDFFYVLDNSTGAAAVLQEAVERELPGVIETAEQVYEDTAEEIRKALYDEHDYLTSDEFIAAQIAECYPEWLDDWYADHPEDGWDEAA